LLKTSPSNRRDTQGNRKRKKRTIEAARSSYSL
jgi:hypothetical protein